MLQTEEVASVHGRCRPVLELMKAGSETWGWSGRWRERRMVQIQDMRSLKQKE